MSTISSPPLRQQALLRRRGFLWMKCREERLERVQLAGVAGRRGWCESGSKLRALQTLRAVGCGPAALRSSRRCDSLARAPTESTRSRPTSRADTLASSMARACCWRAASLTLACWSLVLRLCSASTFMMHPHEPQWPQGTSTEPREGLGGIGWAAIQREPGFGFHWSFCGIFATLLAGL